MKTITRNLIENFYQGLLTPEPTTLNVEVTNVCNLDCIMCPAHSVKRPKGMMDLDLYKDVLAEAVEMGIRQIGLHTVGESILHPRIAEFVSVSKATGLYTYMDVNGNRVRPGLAREIVAAGLDSLKFSIDAHEPGLYARIRRGGDLGKVMDNLKAFDAARKELNPSMRLYALYIISSLNEPYVEDFMNLVRPFVDEVEVSLVLNQGEQFDGYEGLVSPRLRELMDRHRKPKPCPNPFRRITVSWDGWLTACCIDFELQMAYAKYEKGRLREAWESQPLERMRQGMLDMDFAAMPMCANCDMMLYDIPALCAELNEMYK